MSDLIDHGLVDRLRSGDCCHENNMDAVSHIEMLDARIDELDGAIAEYFTPDEVIQIRGHYGKRIAELEADNKRLREALTHLAEGSAPWIDGYYTEAWEVMAAHAKKALEEGER